MPQSTPQRDFALQVVQQLRETGFEALWAGGCVRDQLLGRLPKDYDVATSARPEEVRELFGRRRTLALGEAFGVIAVLGRRGQPPIEVATFRSDGAYVDGRRPEGVVFTTAEEDAQRRDFTINGLFFDPVDERVIDYVGGEKDLQRGILRAIGNPSARFAEDKLRMLRAVRFATTLGFQIEDVTLAAIRAMADEVTVVSAERIGAELRRLFVHSDRSLGIELLRKTQLLEVLLPEVAVLAENEVLAWQLLLQHLSRLESDSLAVTFAVLLLANENPELVGKVGRRFRFTNKEVERATWLVGNFRWIDEAETLPWPKLQRLLVHDGGAELLSLADAVLGTDHRGVRECRQRLSLPVDKLDPPPLFTGQDLIAQGVPPGPDFALILRHLRDEQLLGHIHDQQGAERLVARWLHERRNG